LTESASAPFRSAGELDGLNILITGASSGIGAALATGVAATGATALAVHYNTGRGGAEEVLRQVTALGADGAHFQADLSVRGAAEDLVRRVIDRFGRIDVLVNNAGTLVERRPTPEMDDEYYNAVLDANLYSTVACCRAVLPGMIDRRAGTVINVSSVAARIGGGSGAALYAAAKGAVSTYTRGLAREVAGFGIRVNALSPGTVATPFHDRFTSPEALAAVTATIPMGRLGRADEMVGPTVFLASEASGYVTGQIIEVNGGQYMP
jgi:3-oxoacyl-[acyl-carrier protein] reductase